MLECIIETFEHNMDQEYKIKQEAYLKNQFSFLGIKQPIRKQLQKEFLIESRELTVDEITELVINLHNLEYREYMYVGRDILSYNVKRLTTDDLLKIMPLIIIKPWWENVDGYVGIFNQVLLKENKIEEFIDAYYKNKNMWIRRMTILVQLKSKKETNLVYLDKVIQYNYKDKEFFIQKAIGWALREYSKTDAQYVLEYINDNNFSNFINKEALKVINKEKNEQ